MNTERLSLFGLLAIVVLSCWLTMPQKPRPAIRIERNVSDIPNQVGSLRSMLYDPYVVRENSFKKILISGVKTQAETK